jgi:hypothetical protein
MVPVFHVTFRYLRFPDLNVLYIGHTEADCFPPILNELLVCSHLQAMKSF